MLPSGFKFSGVTSGIKPSGSPDLALIVCEQPTVAAGVYTSNLIHAANIDWNRSITPTDRFRALVVNSGNANACTGDQGIEDNRQMAAEAAGAIGCDAKQVCVLSTGIIGRHLPMERVVAGIGSANDCLGTSNEHFEAASRAILTTDKENKTAHRSFQLKDKTVNIVGMAKGAGMIGPRMATMLAVICTDAKISSTNAQIVLTVAADASFNRISVEGHMSTSDAMLLIASGAGEAEIDSPECVQTFSRHLNELCVELARQIPADGEGATHLIEIRVTGAKTDADADKIARSIAASSLVKTAIAGNDPNWGRIVSAAGYCGVDIAAEDVALTLNGHPVFSAGQPLAFDARTVSHSIRDSFDTSVELVVGSGPGKAVHWTSDLTVDYVRFNSEYTT